MRYDRINPSSRRRGMVLILVLVVIALLSLASFTFSRLMLSERRASHLSARQAQARALADSGMERARVFLALDEESQNEFGGWYDNPTEFQGVAVVSDEQRGDTGRFTVVAPRSTDGYDDGIRFGLEDESARLNLSTLLLADGAGEGTAREILLQLPGMTEEIADAILDWIDEDDDPRELGAEADDYASYVPKNGPLETVEELLLVRGVTPWMLFGADGNRNMLADSDEPDVESIGGVDNSDGTMNRGWAGYLTLHSLELNLNDNGEPKIDLNQDDLEELYDELETALGSEWATFIVAFRQNGPHDGEEEGESPGSGEIDFSQKSKHEFSTILDLIGPNVEVKFDGEQEQTVLQTPFADIPGTMNSFLPMLMENVAVNASKIIPGRININQASRVVLSGIPGIDEETVQAIISQRDLDPADAEADRRYETWILNQGIVTLDEMKALMPFVTGGGSVFRAQVIGYFDRGGPSVRIEVLLDGTTVPARIRFYRDLSHLGRGYPLETLGIDLDGQ